MNRIIKSTLITAVFIGTIGASVTLRTTNASAKARVISTKNVSKKPYTVSNGYFYSSAKLTKKTHNQHNYLRTTFYSYKSATVKKNNGKRAVYYYVKNKSGSVKGWVWRGSLVKPKTYAQEKSDMNNVVAILKTMSPQVQQHNTLAQFRHMDYKRPYNNWNSNGGRCLSSVLMNVEYGMTGDSPSALQTDVQGILKLYEVFKGRLGTQGNRVLSSDYDDLDDAMHGNTANNSLDDAATMLIDNLSVYVNDL